MFWCVLLMLLGSCDAAQLPVWQRCCSLQSANAEVLTVKRRYLHEGMQLFRHAYASGSVFHETLVKAQQQLDAQEYKGALLGSEQTPAQKTGKLCTYWCHKIFMINIVCELWSTFPDVFANIHVCTVCAVIFIGFNVQRFCWSVAICENLGTRYMDTAQWPLIANFETLNLWSINPVKMKMHMIYYVYMVQYY